MKTILSIDWDFYIKVSKEYRESSFPNFEKGANKFSAPSSFFKWFDSNLDMKEVSVFKDGILNLMKNISLYFTIEGLNISLSHADLFGALENWVGEKEEFTIINYDLHSDCFTGTILNGEQKLDCSNWVHFVKNKYLDRCTIKWIYPTYNHEEALWDSYLLQDSFKYSFDLENSMFREFAEDKIYVFICRSDAWTPPMFDDDFNSFCRFFCKSFQMLYNEHALKNVLVKR